MSIEGLGPFVTGMHEGDLIGEVTVDGRLRMVKSFKRDQCLRALRMAKLQTIVRKAVERRLRQLDKGPMDYDPNLTLCGRMATQRVRLTFGSWQYRHSMEVNVGGNCTGLTVIKAAVEQAYVELPYTMRLGEGLVAKMTLTDQEGDSLLCEDDELRGENWLTDMLVAAEIISIQPKETAHD